MKKVIIIDDEPLARSLVKEYLQAFPELEVVQECNDGFEGLKAIQQINPDLIFLDIQMPKISGFEMLELIEQPPAIIFTTAYDEYAIKAFENNAVDYLLKPFNEERFNKAIQKWLQQQPEQEQKTEGDLLKMAAGMPQQRDRVVVKTGSHIKIIPVDDIFYLEAADDYVKIHTKEGHFLKNRTMAHFERLLDERIFIRSHRSYMVNIQHITRINPHEKENYLAILKSGQQVPVSKNGYAKLRVVLGI